MKQRLIIEIDPEKLSDLIQLAEESDMSKIVDQAVALLYTGLLMQTKGYRLGLIPITLNNVIDRAKAPIFLNVTAL